MELLQLKYFQKAAELEHMTRAAEALFVSQPALSRSIHRLEQELGVPLFEKHGQGIRLTEYGQHFSRHVAVIFSELRQAEAERDDLLGCANSAIRVGSTIPGVTLPVLERYLAEAPDSPVQYAFYGSNEDLLEALQKETLSLGFCDVQTIPSGFEAKTIWQDQLYAIVPQEHPLTGKDTLRREELLDQPLILSKAEASLSEMIGGFLECEKPLRCTASASLPEALRLCTMGLGITITSGYFLELQMQESKHEGKSLLDFAVPVPLERTGWNISLIWKRQNYYSLTLRRFLAFALAYYQSQSEKSILQSIRKKENMALYQLQEYERRQGGE